MSTQSMQRVAELMRKIDLCELITLKDGAIAGRPMSNNGEVEYDGDSYFFTRASSGMVADIHHNAGVALVFHKTPGLLAGGPVFVHLQGQAEVVKDRARFAKHWHKGLDVWFKEGIDTPDLTMIVIQAQRIAFWDGEEHGEIRLPTSS